MEDLQGNIIIGQIKVQKTWENYIAELYDRDSRPENLKVETEEEVDEDENSPYISHSEMEKAIKEMKY